MKYWPKYQLRNLIKLMEVFKPDDKFSEMQKVHLTVSHVKASLWALVKNMNMAQSTLIQN